jgi:NADH-quinone oxidoreductase subunit J
VILFWILALALVLSAVWTISQKSPVYSVVGLLANFVALGILYLSLNAEFVFVMQILVYSGAILVLFLFVIALLSSGVGPFPEGPNRLPRILVPALLFVSIGTGLVAFALARGAESLALAPAAAAAGVGVVGTGGSFGSVADFGAALFTTHLLPFEVTALVLLVAVIGVVMLAGDAVPQATRGSHLPRRPKRQREPIAKVGR